MSLFASNKNASANPSNKCQCECDCKDHTDKINALDESNSSLSNRLDDVKIYAMAALGLAAVALTLAIWNSVTSDNNGERDVYYRVIQAPSHSYPMSSIGESIPDYDSETSKPDWENQPELSAPENGQPGFAPDSSEDSR